MFRPTSIRSLSLAIVVAISNVAPAAAREPIGLRYDEIPEGVYAVVAEVHAKPGKESELREATFRLLRDIREQGGFRSPQRHGACAGLVREIAGAR